MAHYELLSFVSIFSYFAGGCVRAIEERKGLKRISFFLCCKTRWNRRFSLACFFPTISFLLHAKHIDSMTDLCLTPFSTLFHLLCTYPCFSGIIFTSIPHSILSKPIIVEKLDSCERGMSFKTQHGDLLMR